MNKRRILATIAAVLAVALAYDSFYIIDEAEQGVLTHFGKISPPVRQPGLHLKFPRPLSKIYKADRRIHTLDSLSQELITQDSEKHPGEPLYAVARLRIPSVTSRPSERTPTPSTVCETSTFPAAVSLSATSPATHSSAWAWNMKTCT